MFKQDFKYYKSKKPPPNFNNVLNFNNPEIFINKVRKINYHDTNYKPFYGLKPTEQWQIYELLDNPGLIFIRNPFTSYGQQYWIMRCLRDYTRKPNKSNLDIHEILKDNQDWWDACHQQGSENIVNMLRWMTLGYHHNWDTKVYSEESRDVFPSDLAALSKYFACVLGFKDFIGEAAIVNYYHMDSTLSGHTDHSERFLEAPLFSFSFGQSALFLLGGTDLDVKPTAMFLHSGDVIVMSKESRLCYHGVPRIVPAEESSWNDYEEHENINANDFAIANKIEINNEESWKPFDKYIESSRININVRQVLKTGEQSLIKC